MLRFAALALLVALLCAAPARACVQAYSSAAGFTAATASITENFESYVPGFYGSFLTTGPASLGTNGSLFVQGTNSYGTGNFLSAQQAPVNVPLNFTAFLPNVTAVGLNYFSGNTGTIAVQTNSGLTLVNLGALTFPNASFIGFTSTSPITSLSYVTPPGGGIDLDNFRLGFTTGGTLVAYSGQVHNIPSNITVDNGALLLAEYESGGSINYEVEPFTIAQAGAITPPPPVKRDTGGTEAVGMAIEYHDSISNTSNVAVLWGQAGGLTPPPPVLAPPNPTGQPFNSVFQGVQESDMLNDLQNGTTGSLIAFMQNNPSWQYQLDNGSSFSGGELMAFSDGHSIGTFDLSSTVVPEPASWILLSLGTVGLFLVNRHRKSYA